MIEERRLMSRRDAVAKRGRSRHGLLAAYLVGCGEDEKKNDSVRVAATTAGTERAGAPQPPGPKT